MTRVFGGACDAPGLPCDGGGLLPKHTAICAPHSRPPQSPQNKIASAAIISTRSIRALSRVKSTTGTKNNASRGIRVTLVIVLINSTLRSRDGSIVVLTLANRPSGFDSSRPQLQAHSLEPERSQFAAAIPSPKVEVPGPREVHLVCIRVVLMEKL
jgi:hypothetical protein